MKSNKKVAVASGKRLPHGTANAVGRGCQCLKCRIYRAKLTGRPQDPHWSPHTDWTPYSKNGQT